MLWSGRVTPFGGALAGGLILQAGLLATAALTTNPDFNFPGVVELGLTGAALVCLAIASHWRETWRRTDRLVTVVMVALLAALALRYVSGLADPANAPALRCLTMPGGSTTVECLLQLPSWTQYGLRQLLLHVTALMMFLAGVRLARLAATNAALLLCVFMLTPLVFALASVAPRFILGQQTLAGWNLVLNAFTGTGRGASGLTSNPGWLWPLLAPAGALAVGLLASRSRPLVVWGSAVLAAVLVAVADAGQRGGYLLLVLLAVSGFVSLIAWRYPFAHAGSGALLRSDPSELWPRRAFLWLGAMAVAITAMAVGSTYLNQILAWLGQFELFSGFAGRTFELSDTSVRGVMWQCAWEHVQPVFWTGNGYASWLRVAGAACADSPFIYDTAHNLWVQMLFELGALHTAVVVCVFIWVFYQVLVVRTNRPVEVDAAVLAYLAAFLLASMVQEVDYIPATYYAFAVTGGVLWGASHHRARRQAAVPQPAPVERGWVTAVLAGAAVLALVSSVIYAWTISWGGYTYVPVSEPGFSFQRWFRPHGAITAVARASNHAYSVYPFAAPLHGRIDIRAEDGEAAVTSTGLSLANGNGPWPRQYSYTATSRAKWLSRLNAFAVYLPPLPSDFMLHGESGVSRWEVSAAGIAEKWCGPACAVDISAAAQPTASRELRVYVEQECTSADRPARVNYTVDVMRLGRLVHERDGDLVFTQPLAPQGIALPGEETPHDLWRVSFRTVPACTGQLPVRSRSGPDFEGVRILFGHGPD